MEYTKAALIFALLLGMSYADVIPVDSHPVDHRLYIDNIGDYSNYQFFIYSTSMGGGAALLTSAEIPYFYKFSRPKLYAVPKDQMPANFSAETYVPPEDALVSEASLGRTDTLPNTDPRTEIETHYTLAIQGKNLVLTEVSGPSHECQPERGLDYWLLLPGVAIGLMLGYLAGKKL